MRVAILTTFADLDMSYSLCGVATEQAAMLAENGVPFDLYVLEADKNRKQDPYAEHRGTWLDEHLREEVPRGRLEEDVINDDLRARTVEWLGKVIAEHDVLITHDWMFTTWNVSYNAAVRDLAEDFPNVTWVHWVHSAPGGRPARAIGPAAMRYDAAPYSLYVYLNEADRLRYAESIGIDVGRVLVCYNPLDAANFFGFEQKAAEFARKFRLFDHDLMQVYPFSMPRAPEKGLEKVISLFGAWKQLGHKVKLLCVNCHTTAEREKAMVRSYRDMAFHEWGLTPMDLVFTSDEPGWEYSVPHKTVRQFFKMSNLFVFPTQSEACSRILQEASLAGCFVIGNASFAPLGEFLHPAVPRHEFGSLRSKVDYQPSMFQWLREVAKATLPLLQHPMLKQKAYMMRLAARETVWREQFLPILVQAEQMAKKRAAACSM